MLEADRIVIYAASESEMLKIAEAEADAHLREAYGEMLRGSLAHPEDWGWYALWLIVRKDGAQIGSLSFKGVPENGTVELGYGISEEYRNLGYATEAVETILAWAFDQPGVNSVAAETEAYCLRSIALYSRLFPLPRRAQPRRAEKPSSRKSPR